MGNTCGCTDDRTKNGEIAGNIHQAAPEQPPFKIANYQSKIAPSTFASLSPLDKDQMLAEAFSILANSVEPHKIAANSVPLKQLTAKTLGRTNNGLGDIYEGEFINGVANGKGKIKHPDGTVYEGDVFRGLRHGQGKITEVGLDARTYKTIFLDGNPLGPASMFSLGKNENSGKLEGAFDAKGRQSGPYRMVYDDGTLAYYTQKDDLPDGPHVYFTTDFKHAIVSEYVADKEVTEPKTYSLKVDAPKTIQPVPIAVPQQDKAIAPVQPTKA